MQVSRTVAVGLFVPSLLLVLSCCLDADAQMQQSTEHAVSGTVVSSTTHEPVGRALVFTSDLTHAAFTDDHGHFEFNLEGLPTGSGAQPGAGYPVSLQAKKPGFLTDAGSQKTITVVRGQKPVTLSLVPEALIVGRVEMPSAESAGQVQVQLYRRDVNEGLAQWLPQNTVETRADGSFRLSGLHPGEYKLFTLEAQERDPLNNLPNGPAYGFPPRYFPAARDFASADTIQLHAGETITANIAPERQRYYEVRIPVAGVESSNRRGMAVSVHPQGHPGPGFALGFDRSQGAVRGTLPNGSYTVEVGSVGPEAATGVASIIVANGPVNAPTMAMAQNTSIDINLHQDLPATGTTQTQTGRIAPDQPAYVALRSAEEFQDGRGGRTLYQAHGVPPVLQGVAPGRYWVQVQAPMGYAASISSGGRDLLRAPLVVPYGASVPPVEIELRFDSAEIEVTVEARPNGSATTVSGGVEGSAERATLVQPAPGVSVYVIPLVNEGRAASQAMGWSNGNALIQNLPPGDYRILAFDSPQSLEYRTPAAMRVYESSGRVVHVKPGEKAQVTVPLIESE